MTAAFVTRCPRCGTAFRVTAPQLLQAGGKVECGACRQLFMGLEQLLNPAPSTLAAALAEAAGKADAGRAPSATGSPARRVSAGGFRLPAPARHTLNLLLALALLLQPFWWLRDTLALNGFLRPQYERLCRLSGCRLPERVRPHRLLISDLLAEKHPEVGGALLLSAKLTNQSGFAQPLPELELRVTDALGKLFACRLLTPDNYLATRPEPRLQAAAEVNISLAILRPDTGALRFSLRLPAAAWSFASPRPCM